MPALTPALGDSAGNPESGDLTHSMERTIHAIHCLPFTHSDYFFFEMKFI